jgi:hypothetical protein
MAQPQEAKEEAKEIPTVKIAVEEYERLKTKAEIYDLILVTQQAQARIAQLERQLQ